VAARAATRRLARLHALSALQVRQRTCGQRPTSLTTQMVIYTSQTKRNLDREQVNCATTSTYMYTAPYVTNNGQD